MRGRQPLYFLLDSKNGGARSDPRIIGIWSIRRLYLKDQGIKTFIDEGEFRLLD